MKHADGAPHRTSPHCDRIERCASAPRRIRALEPLLVGPTLGASTDAEADGQPTAAADGDDSWGGPGEQNFDTVAVNNGNNALEFDVPSRAVFKRNLDVRSESK